MSSSLRSVAFGLSAASALTASAAERPNIVFFFSDDHAAQAVSAYGSDRNTTPNIDRLAREGMLFERCYATNAICAPSRAVVLTGKHSHLNGQLTNLETFDGTQQTFPKLMRDAGYTTALVGKWHLRSTPTGFDHYRIFPGQGPYYNPLILSPLGGDQRTGYTTDVITDLATTWLDGRDTSEPFILMVQHKAPHRNWQPAPRHMNLFEQDLPEPPTLFDDYATRNSGALTQEMSIANHLRPGPDLKIDWTPNNLNDDQRTAWESFYRPQDAAFEQMDLEGDALVRYFYQRYVKDYLRTIQTVDESVGTVIDKLDELGLSDNTVVIYTSDQGFFLGEHGWYDKRWFYEESAQMPLIVRWPSLTEPGSRADHLVQNLDFAPTFLDLAGAPVPRDMQGQSLVPILRGEEPKDWRDAIYYRYYEFPAEHAVPQHYGIRTDRHKIIRYPATDEWELFDLEADPDELHNLGTTHPMFRNLRQKLARTQAKYGDSPERDWLWHRNAPNG